MIFSNQKCLGKFLAVGLVMTLMGTIFFALPKFSIAQKVKLVYWQHMAISRAEAMREIYKEFQKENPNIEVDLNFIPWAAYFDKLFVSIAAGTGPDVFQIPMGLADKFIRSEGIVSLDVSVEEAMQDYLSWTIERLIVKDKVWGLPTDTQSIMLFINNRLAREAGLNPNNPPSHWDEVIEWAKKLTKRKADGTMIQSGIDTDYYSITFEAFAFQAGAPPMYNETKTKALFNGSNEGAVKALTYMTDFTTKYHADDVGFNAGPSSETFPLEKTAMATGHPVGMGDFEMRNPVLDYTALMLPPVRPTDLPVSAGTHWVYFIAKKAPKEAAIEWVKKMSSEKAQRIFVRVAGDTVSRKALLEDPELRKDPNRATALDSLLYCQPLTWIGWAEPHKLYSEAIERIVYGKATPVESLDILAEAITKILAG
ncbi:MAG: extracellular solute-binding protein [Clostridia bacterium]|jgi:multiple sugar transport system substrate-binding protein|nr:extracellular solute-binding protein [Clostridia bacterium]